MICIGRVAIIHGAIRRSRLGVITRWRRCVSLVRRISRIGRVARTLRGITRKRRVWRGACSLGGGYPTLKSVFGVGGGGWWGEKRVLLIFFYSTPPPPHTRCPMLI